MDTPATSPAAKGACAPAAPLALPAHPEGDRFGRDRGALRLPEFLRRPVGKGEQVAAVKRLMREGDLHTVCEEARCPNLQECFSHGTATFMIMGKDCTRACSFCAVGTARPGPLDPEEPASVARAAARLGLRHVVITSVNRDDLPDGGSEHMRQTVEEVHAALPHATIEVLAPDFLDDLDATRRVASARGLSVYNHNVETVPRLYGRVRHRARYARTLGVLKTVAREFPRLKVKTGLMVGLGETREEVFALMEDLHAQGVHILTIGQYLRPSIKHMPVAEYVTEEGYDDYRARGLLVGFEHVYAGPFVRSSYNAAEALRHAQEAAQRAPARSPAPLTPHALETPTP